MEQDEYGWVRASTIRDAGCLTLVESADPAAVARAFGGEYGTARGDLAVLGEDPAVAIRPVAGGWILVVEHNGWQGSRSEVLREASRTGQAVSAYWSVDADTRFSYASGGQLLGTFTATTPDQQPEVLRRYLAGLDWTDGDPVPPMLALLARVTGTDPAPQWLTGPFAIVPVLPQAEQPPQTAHPELYQLSYDQPVLAYHLRRAPADTLRTVAEAAASAAVAAAGQAELPPVSSPAFDQLYRRTLAAIPKAGAAQLPTLRGRYYALDAIREAAGPDPVAAAFGSVTAAATGLAVAEIPPTTLYRELRSLLGDPPAPSGSLGLPATPPYRWITRHWLAVAGALAFVHGRTDPPTGDATRGVPALSDEPIVAVRRSGEWTIAVAGPAGGLDLPTATRLSTRATPVLLITWQAKGRLRVWYLRDGELLTQLDPQRPEQNGGTRPDALDRYTTGLTMPIPGADVIGHLPFALALAHRVTGVDMTPAVLDQPHLLIPRPWN